MTNVERLQHQNIIASGTLDQTLADHINKLSESELQVIIDLHNLDANKTPWPIDHNGRLSVPIL
jgi:hypothetical protein